MRFWRLPGIGGAARPKLDSGAHYTPAGKSTLSFGAFS